MYTKASASKSVAPLVAIEPVAAAGPVFGLVDRDGLGDVGPHIRASLSLGHAHSKRDLDGQWAP